MVTAGHCVQNNEGSEVDLLVPGTKIGTASHAFMDDGLDDVGSILMGTPSVTVGVFGGTGYYQYEQNGTDSTTAYVYWDGPTQPGPGTYVTPGLLT
jgi:hypothetical protein